jgi:hypothetical protein
MTEDMQLEYDAFLRSFKRNVDVPHSFLLGAGASITSGVQSAYDCIWEWKKDIYLSKNINSAEFYRNYKEEAVRKSIQNWLDMQGIYPPLDSAEEYSFYVEKAYPIPDDRRKYFSSLIEKKEPYIGYKLLCLLAEHNIVKSVWTTNFDGLIVRSAYQNNLTPIEITLDNSERIFRNQSNKELLTIALHGDYKYSTLKNTEKELDNQNDTFKEQFANYHLDKNLIVIGYSGRDKSLMDAILNAFSRQGAGRLYWCGYGDQINKELFELIIKIRQSGREAYYVSTDGFDKTIIHLSKSAFEGKVSIEKQIQEALEASQNEEYYKTEFSLNFVKTDKYIKSNLHPITFPKEIFQFEVDYKGQKPWSFLKETTKTTSVCAVPFKKKVFAIGTLTDIDKIFKSQLKSEIKREPISKFDIDNVAAFRSLMMTAILKYFKSKYPVDTNLKDKLWMNKIESNKGNINIHKALYLSFYFDRNKSFAYLSFIPAIHLTSKDEISTQEKLLISKGQLEKLYNDQYDNSLSFWNSILFPNQKIKFEYPESSGTGFEFSISSNTAFGEIYVLDSNFRAYHPREYNQKQTQFKGVQFLEPQLIFRHIATNAEFKDYHPMRGLVNNRPFDVNLNGVIYSDEVNLSVICGINYSNKFYDFLSEIHTKHLTGNINPDYLSDYPGFSNVFNLPIII